MGIMGHCIVQAALSTHPVFTMIASYSRTGLRDADGSRGRLREGSQDLLRAGEGLRFLSSGEGLRRRSLHAHHKVASAPPNSCFKGSYSRVEYESVDSTLLSQAFPSLESGRAERCGRTLGCGCAF